MPDEQDTLLPAQAGPPSGATPFSDQDKQMIVKAILDLKQEVDTLKQMVNAGVATAAPQPVIAPPHIDEPEEQTGTFDEPAPLPELSIKQLGDEAIERALARHGGKVGPAAKELGISERTIYRKLAAKNKKG